MFVCGDPKEDHMADRKPLWYPNARCGSGASSEVSGVSPFGAFFALNPFCPAPAQPVVKPSSYSTER